MRLKNAETRANFHRARGEAEGAVCAAAQAIAGGGALRSRTGTTGLLIWMSQEQGELLWAAVIILRLSAFFSAALFVRVPKGWQAGRLR